MIRYVILSFFLMTLALPVSHARAFGAKEAEPNALVEAAGSRGGEDTIQQLLNEGFAVDSVDSRGYTALMRAAIAGNDATVNMLVSKGADINLTNPRGQTALHLAASHDRPTIADFLVRHGASAEIKDRFGLTPTEAALKTKNFQVVQVLDSWSMKMPTKAIAAPQLAPTKSVKAASPVPEQAEIVRFQDEPVARENSDISAREMFRTETARHDDRPPQYQVAQADTYPTPIVEAEAAQPEANFAVDPANDIPPQAPANDALALDVVDELGYTPLMRAAKDGDLAHVQTLVEQGANVNVANARGQTALHIAARHDHADIADFLVHNGASTTLKDIFGLTALDTAMKMKNFQVVQVVDAATPPVPKSSPLIPTITGFQLAAIGTTAAIAGGLAVAASNTGVLNGPSPAVVAASEEGSYTVGTAPSEDYVTSPGYEAEYAAQYGLGNMKAINAYYNGSTGAGVTIGIVDTGVDLDHPDLQANIISAGADFTGEGHPNAEDGNGHGTHVAGIAAGVRNAAGIHGVAYDAKILPVRVLDDSGAGTWPAVVSGINYAVANGANVINLSLGGGADSDTKTAIQNAVNAGVVIAAATGNDGASEPGWPAAYAGDATVNTGSTDGALLAVGATDANNSLASFSNHCGAAKDWCLVAPGYEIYSTYLAGAYDTKSGTSMATPQVSGAVAVLMDNFPHLNGREVAEILLTTSTDLGASGVDTVYGHGLVNLYRAIQPVGETSIPLGVSVSGSGAGVSSSIVRASSAFGGALENTGLHLAILDSYKRAYSVSLSDVVSSKDTFNTFERMFDHFADDREKTNIQLSDDLQLAFSYTVNDAESVADGEPSTRFAIDAKFEDSSVSVGYNVPMQQAFHPTSLGDEHLLADRNMGASSVMGLIDTGSSYSQDFALNEHSRVKMGSFFSNKDDNNVYGMVNEYTYAFDAAEDSAKIGVQLGMMNEENTFLGTQADGAFAIGSNTPTWFYNLSGNLPLNENLSIFGGYDYSVSFPTGAANSLLSDMSQVQSDAFRLGFSKSNSFMLDDRFDLVLSQPLRVSSGQANIDLPQGRDIDGNIAREVYRVNMSPTGRELDIGAFYVFLIGQFSSVNTGAIYRIEPGHVRDAADDFMMMLKYNLKF